MADLSDVETALAELVSHAVYPLGTDQPSSIGADVRVVRGWPTKDSLEADLADGWVTVSVFPKEGTSKLTTRFLAGWKELPKGTVPLLVETSTVAGNSVCSFFGFPRDRMRVGVRWRNQAFCVPVESTDTPSSIASRLAALIPGATAFGDDITAPYAHDWLVRVAVTGKAQREVRRQSHGVTITVWAPSPELRDSASIAVDSFIAARDWLSLPDGSEGQLLYTGTTPVDDAQEAGLYRRDFEFTVEYGLFEFRDVPTVLFGISGTTVTNTGTTVTAVV